ncbi:RNA 2',3'-cyclic phosphodiesterase [Candidatus Bathyarchaeota archaeon]|nr:RNA 2',3'-cyclic phosphodiesterase [Candidatus Bathyarchaeota archaeon]
MEMIRSFIAVDIDDATVLENLSKIQERLLRTGADLKLVKPENIHITLKFLGDITMTMVDQIYNEMDQVYFGPFEIKIKGIGAFPNLRRISIVWAGIHQGNNELRAIFNQLESRLQTLGFKQDYKGFSPHLTIARVRTGKNKELLVRELNCLADYEFGTVAAKCLRLKKSVLTPQGPIYSVLRETYGKRLNAQESR